MTKPKIHIVLYSGGICSWATTKRLLTRVKRENVRLVFCDTRMEDEDLYRFLDETTAAFGIDLVRLCDGRTPWEVFRDERFLGNSRVDLCSRVLKKELFQRWLRERYQPHECYIYLGIDWTEIHRYHAAKPRWLPYQLRCPMVEPPYIDKDRMFAMLAEDGIAPPRLYDLGFVHNNCGGFCIKAGQAHYAHLLKTFPERYRHHEEQEEAMRASLGKDVAILAEQRGKQPRKPLTLRVLRERIEAKCDVDPFEIGGCGCMSDS